MNSPIAMQIAGVGRYLPNRVVAASEVAQMCGVETQWVKDRTGVHERRWVSEDAGEGNATMAAHAAKEALQDANIRADQVDCLIYASATVQQLIPDTSVYVLQELGLSEAGISCLSVHSTCLSFVTALEVAAGRIAMGRSRRVLVVSSEITSGGLNFQDPESAALFGDGAAAVLVTSTPEGEASCLEAVRFETYASAAELTTLKGCGTRKAPNDSRTTHKDNLFAMDGPEVLRFTLRRAPRFLARMLGKARLDDIECIIPHQTSRAGLDAMERLGMSESKLVRILASVGNCVAASIPMALYEAVQTRRLQRGQRCLLVGTSAGLTLGGMVLTY